MCALVTERMVRKTMDSLQRDQMKWKVDIISSLARIKYNSPLWGGVTSSPGSCGWSLVYCGTLYGCHGRWGSSGGRGASCCCSLGLPCLSLLTLGWTGAVPGAGAGAVAGAGGGASPSCCCVAGSVLVMDTLATFGWQNSLLLLRVAPGSR